MRPLETKGRKALNKAYLNLNNMSREEIEAFKRHLLTLLDNLAAKGHEGQQKTLVATFLRDAFYKDSHQVNEKDKIDLAIFTGKSVKDPVGVIIEVKSTKNAGEMFGATNLGAKSMCELVLYYLRERVDADNHDLRHMVITNGYDWYLFDTATFYRLFFNAGIKKVSRENGDPASELVWRTSCNARVTLCNAHYMRKAISTLPWISKKLGQ